MSSGGARATLVGAKNNQVKSTLSAAEVCGNGVVLRAKKQETDCASDCILRRSAEEFGGCRGVYVLRYYTYNKELLAIVNYFK